MATIDKLVAPKVFKLTTATKTVDKLNSKDDDWTYKVIPCNGGAVIAVYDEDNRLLGYL